MNKSITDLATIIANKNGFNDKNLHLAYKKVCDIYNDQEAKNKVICHGDSWPNNFMFDSSEPPKNCIILDFQITRYASYILDVLQMIYLCTDRETRNKNEKILLTNYHNQLCKTLNNNKINLNIKNPTIDYIIEEYEDKRICGAVLAALYYPIITLSQNTINKFNNDPEYEKKFMFRENNDCVIEEMENDPEYSRRITEAVQELVDILDK